MGACHECRCFYCENLCTKKCPVGRVCSTCYKGLNSQSFKITHCDKQIPYDPAYNVTTAPGKPQKKRPARKRRKRSGLNGKN